MTELSALPIGIAFGFVLERAGLGDPRKLAAQFTLADFTVLKVMLTAIVTAGVGLFWLGRSGAIDLTTIYLPPTNLLPQVVGGVIFGAGFAIGGYCPGTSCVAAAAGRGDAAALVGGMLAGTVAFAEAFPLLEPLYSATPLGAVTWYAAAGIPQGMALALLLAGALALSLVAQHLEGRAVGRRGVAMLALGALLAGVPLAAAGTAVRVGVPAGRPAAAADTIPPVRDPAPGWRSAGGCGAP